MPMNTDAKMESKLLRKKNNIYFLSDMFSIFCKKNKQYDKL